MMDITCIFMSILMIVADGFIVNGSSAPLFARLGSSVVLPCYVDELLLMEDLEVQWRRTDSETLVHLYQDGESRPEVHQQVYHDRAHFFTDQIQHGNFSLRLDDLRAEDEGRYTCKVYTQQDSGETVVQIKQECLLVSGSDRFVSAHDGEDVTLSCSVDSHIKLEHIEEVSWIRTDEDGDIRVLLFQNNKTLPDSSDEQYRDRVEFFTAEIPKGNFSLRLKSVRTEDKGVYMCQVFAGGLSANATVELETLGFSSWHIAVLFFCSAAGSGAVFLLCSLIYCRSKNTVTSSIIWTLQVSLVFCPNICMFFALMLWSFIEGSLHETVTCCALYLLRPVTLMWALRYLKNLQANHKSWIRFFRITDEFTILTVIVYSVLIAYGWKTHAHDTNNGNLKLAEIFFGVLVLFSLFLNGGMRCSCVMRMVDIRMQFSIVCVSFLYFSQLIQLMFSFGRPSPVISILGFIQPLMLCCIPLLTRLQARLRCLHHRWIIILWIMIIITLLDIILVIYAHLTILERERESLEWTCVILFVEVLKITVIIENFWLKHMLKDLTDAEILTEAERSRVQRRRRQTETSQQGANTLSLCNEIMFMFGAVGLVLLSSVTLTTDLILKARNGERVMKDMRFIVFPSESVFVFCWLILQTHDFWRNVTTGFGSKHNQRRSHQRAQLMNTPETREMENLSAADPDVSQTQT